MSRLTPLVIAGLVAAAGWLPVGEHLPVASAEPLRAQQGTSGSASRDTGADDDDDRDTDDQQDDDDQHTVVMPRAHDDAGQRSVDDGRLLRPGRDTASPMHVDVTYSMGTLSLEPADGRWLYDVRLNYRSSQEAPRITYDTATRTLRVSGTKHGDDVNIDFGDHPSHDRGDEDLHVALAKHVPLDLALHFGAGDATAQLGGLSVEQLTMETGAADVTVSFSSPNPTTLQDMDLKVGAADFEATGLGNAHVRHMNVRAAAGNVDLDFGGRWTGDATLDLKAAIGAVHIHVPTGVVVDLSPSGGKAIIGSVDNSANGPTTPQTPGGPIYHLHVHSTAALGAIDIDRLTKG